MDQNDYEQLDDDEVIKDEDEYEDELLDEFEDDEITLEQIKSQTHSSKKHRIKSETDSEDEEYIPSKLKMQNNKKETKVPVRNTRRSKRKKELSINDEKIEHDNNHNDETTSEPSVCVMCTSYAEERYMLLHQLRYHTVHIDGVLHKTRCNICTKVFSKAASLQKHINRQHKTGKKYEKLYPCDVCGKVYKAADKLNIHYRLHTGERPFACKYCDKSFTKKDYLVSHERVHTGEKPFSCKVCNKCFNQASSLKVHIRRHTGEKPFECVDCKKKFVSKGALQVHVPKCGTVPKRARN